jgi:hypothetical protein
MLGEKWKALNDKERKPYEDKAAADKKRYEEEKAQYNVSITMTARKTRADLLNPRLPKRKKNRPK